MQTRNNYLEQLATFAETAIEYVTVSFLLALSVLFVSSAWRKNKTYFLSAVIFGTVVGYAAGQTPMLAPFDVVLTVIACISAPPTIALFQHKNLFQIIKDIKDLKDDK